MAGLGAWRDGPPVQREQRALFPECEAEPDEQPLDYLSAWFGREFARREAGLLPLFAGLAISEAHSRAAFAAFDEEFRGLYDLALEAVAWGLDAGHEMENRCYDASEAFFDTWTHYTEARRLAELAGTVNEGLAERFTLKRTRRARGKEYRRSPRPPRPRKPRRALLDDCGEHADYWEAASRDQ